ncbi:MAG TPA: hypothetical protein VF043_36055 [Ktedonobacteraceae bacterium]
MVEVGGDPCGRPRWGLIELVTRDGQPSRSPPRVTQGPLFRIIVDWRPLSTTPNSVIGADNSALGAMNRPLLKRNYHGSHY